MSELADNCDFKTYKRKFRGYNFQLCEVLRVNIEEGGIREGDYRVLIRDLTDNGRLEENFVDKECGKEVEEAKYAIYEDAASIEGYPLGADCSFTFYSSEGKLLCGYEYVDGEKKIIKPNKKSEKECNATLKERIANKKINNEGELATVWVDPNDPSKGRVPVSPLDTRSLLDKIRERKKGIKGDVATLKERIADKINNEGELADNCDFKPNKNDRSGDERQSFASLVAKMAVAENRSKTPDDILAEDKQCTVGRTPDDIAKAHESIDKMPQALSLLGKAMMDEGLPGFMVVSKLKDIRDILSSQGAERDYYTKEKEAFFAPDMPAVECLEQLQKDGVLNEKLAILKPEKFLESKIVTTAAGLHVANIDLRNTPTMQNYKMFTDYMRRNRLYKGYKK